MTILVKGKNSYFMSARAYLLDNDREMASDWASKHVVNNDAIKWVLGSFVEANNPNNNRQAWSLEDLRLKRPTINHAPMNMVHQANRIVGAFVASEMIYPAEAAANTNPYVEALGAFWKYYFPQELKLVQAAHDEGSLFFSMECVAQSVTFEDVSSGLKEEFPYRGPFDESYGKWNDNREATRWLNNPHFLAGALIVPPVKPGWSNAEIKSLAKYMEDNQEMAESVYTSVKEQASHLSEAQIEAITVGLIGGQIENDWAELIENSNSSSHLTNTGTVQESDAASDVKPSTEGGDMSTFTEDDVKAAVAEAVKPLQVELDALKAAADAEAIETRIEEAKAEVQAKLDEVQTALDAAMIEAQTAKDERDAFVAWLQGEADAQAEAALRAERQEARLAAVKEAANFPQEFIDAQTERWLAMSDEDFETAVEGYKAAAEAAKSTKKEPTPVPALGDTAMKAEREVASDGTSAVGELMRLRFQGLDPRTV